ncbi:protein phosphatase 2C, putative [Trichomonas vaginalis G3]|uniref:Protein phosphatase 2C, putative n=1 Tax=Trichomonas vaginalis (strain ATCC PRA-98 / G3) TaxID=412133 RepID=A2ENP6_TRIV3|nr:protein serine/threonine phosphatase protein [Trichomonas vaginalis G3]EAY05746.1 protein phosphatase 2C, putative [Trichomonas vaginalis G3]KAI5535141.1 protein serine/threonine phosphatase protein [Trichomonas vaginalis G3]|eukprot:XP_001317969.1 protein phosphatase 2C [Trichomonas vaginalis G3]
MFSKTLGAPLKDPNFIVLGRQAFSCGHSNTVGVRPTMEDTAVVVGDFAGPNTSYYGLFDGHGGVDCALYCANNFHRIFASKFHITANVETVIKETILELNNVAVKRWPSQGCTLAVVLIIKDIIYTANLGDTRIILVNGEQTTRLSYDHKATDQEEADKIAKIGGAVFGGRVLGVLAITRAIGDGELNGYLIREPTMNRLKRKDGMQLIIACDGVWDVMTDEEAARIVKTSNNTAESARKIKDTAVSRSTLDNVSVLVINLNYK